MLSGGLPKAGVARCSRKRRCQSSRYASSPLRSLPPPVWTREGQATASMRPPSFPARLYISLSEYCRWVCVHRAWRLQMAECQVCGETGVLEVIYCRSVAAALKERATAVTPRPGRLRIGWIK